MIQLTNVFKILSDETRLRIIVLLFKEDLCVCELSGILEVPQPKISKNLSKLRDMNFVMDERKEKFVFYSLRSGNDVLNNILENITENLSNYPQLALDRSRLSDKEKYLTQCCVNCD